MQYENLSIAARTGTYANRRDRGLLGNARGHFRRDTFQHDGERPRFRRSAGIVQQRRFVALHAIAAELMNALWPQSTVSHHGNPR